MLKADALFIAVLNNAPSYFLIYKDLKALEVLSFLPIFVVTHISDHYEQ